MRTWWLVCALLLATATARELLQAGESPMVEDEEDDEGTGEMDTAALPLNIVVAGPTMESDDELMSFTEDAARETKEDPEESSISQEVMDLATEIYGQIQGPPNQKAYNVIQENVDAGEVEALGIAIASAATVDADDAASLIYQMIRQQLSIDDILESVLFGVEYGGAPVATMAAKILEKFTMEDPPYPGSELAFKYVQGNATAGREIFEEVQVIIDKNGCAGWSRLISGALILGETSNITTDVDNAIRQGSINNCISRFGPPNVPLSGLNNIGIGDPEELGALLLSEAQRALQTENSGPFVSALDSAGVRYQVDDLADVFEVAIERAIADPAALFILQSILPSLSGFAGPGVQLGLAKGMNRVREEYGCEVLGNLLTLLTSKASEQKQFYQWSLAMQQEEGLIDCIGVSVDTCIGFALRDCCYPGEDGEMPERCSNCGFQLGCRFIQDSSSVKEIGYFAYKDQRFNDALCKCPMIM